MSLRCLLGIHKWKLIDSYKSTTVILTKEKCTRCSKINIISW